MSTLRTVRDMVEILPTEGLL